MIKSYNYFRRGGAAFPPPRYYYERGQTKNEIQCYRHASKLNVESCEQEQNGKQSELKGNQRASPKLQNMNYVCTHIIKQFLLIFSFLLIVFRKTMVFRMYFGIAGVSCTIICYFESRIRILCIFLYMGTYFNNIFNIVRQINRKFSQKCG